jgi:hypothetical protein
MPPYHNHHAGIIKNMTRPNAEADEGKWHRKIPPTEELATHLWQAARRGARLLIARMLTVGNQRKHDGNEGG